MTIDKKDFIKIPKWLVIVFLPILISGITAYGVVRTKDAKIEKQVEINTILLEDKADCDDMLSIWEALHRIEGDVTIIKTALINK